MRPISSFLLSAALPLGLSLTLIGPAPEAHACSYALGPNTATFEREADLPPVSEVNDRTAPEQPNLSGLRLHLATAPIPSDGQSCPALDWLELDIAGRDDRAAPERTWLVAYFGGDEAATSSAAPGLYLAYPPEGRLVVNLGEVTASDDERVPFRSRDGAPFRERGRRCFAFALRDDAGNVGARSSPVCVDTTDVNDPRAELYTPRRASGCSAAPGLAPWLVTSLGLFVARRRRPRSAGRQ